MTMNSTIGHQYITDARDYRHLADRKRYKALYDDVGTLEANRQVRRREERMKYFNPRPAARILELGAHNGPNLIHYARKGHVVHGVELSDTLAETFVSALAGEPPDVQARIRMYRGWIADFKPEESYDHVLCAEILEHVTDPVEVLKVARAALTASGTLYLSGPSRHWGNNTYVRGVPAADLERWLKSARLTYSEMWEEEGRTFCIAHATDLRVIGLTRVRNEAAIIRETLDHMARFCNGGIVVYDDVSSDSTPEICRAHPAVLDVVRGELWDGNRGRAEYAGRAVLLARGKREAGPRDWFVYMDADERIEFDWSSLLLCPDDVVGVRMKLFDYYITEEDVQRSYAERRWLGPEYRPILMAFRNLPSLSYSRPDQRQADLGPDGTILDAGHVKHYGKAVSVAQWEDACRYYSGYFAGYAAKWNARKGKAVHTHSDFGNPLIRWEEKEAKGIPLTPEIEAAAAQKTLAEPRPGLRVLLTNHQLLDFTGSELFTYTVADFLRREGHEVVVYSRYVDKIGRRLRGIGVRVVQDLDEIAGERFDIAHVHHNLNAMEIRHRFPQLPIIMVSHGVLPFLEQPPAVDLRIARYLAVSEEVRENLLSRGVPAGTVSVFRNVVDSQRFSPTCPIREKPERALVLSSRLDSGRERTVREAFSALGILGRFVGGRFGEADPSLLPSYINEADIVFSLGRGAVEAMLCGRIPVIYDYLGADGLVTPGNLGDLMARNFSGRTHRTEYTPAQLADEIRQYRREYGWQLRTLALEHFDAGTRMPGLIRIYHEALSVAVPEMSTRDKEQLSAFVETVRETRNYSYSQVIRKHGRDLQALSRTTIPAPGLPTGAEAARSAAELRDLLWLDGTESGAHHELGLLHYARGSKHDALECFRKAVELDREDAAASKDLALLYLEMWPALARERDERTEQLQRQECRIKELEAHNSNLRQIVECTMPRMRTELYEEKMLRLASRIRRRGIRDVLVYGAGEAGRAFARAAQTVGLRPCGFVDKKPSLWGSQVEGVEVLSLDAAMGRGIHVYAVGSFAFASEIQHEIRLAYAAAGCRPRIFAIH